MFPFCILLVTSNARRIREVPLLLVMVTVAAGVAGLCETPFLNRSWSSACMHASIFGWFYFKKKVLNLGGRHKQKVGAINDLFRYCFGYAYIAIAGHGQTSIFLQVLFLYGFQFVTLNWISDPRSLGILVPNRSRYCPRRGEFSSSAHSFVLGWHTSRS